ncbi:MAG TPA: glycosyltransferase [Pyrinomonadaceae bacterium]|nr:glycosyltransferase [Pyrinomonadaceae bacterium]
MTQDISHSSSASRLHKPLAGRRIIIMLGPLVLGGSERQALLLATYLKNEQNADVRVWGTEPGRVAELCDQLEIPWQLVPCPWVGRRLRLLSNLAKLAWRLRRARADVILPYMSLPSFACNFVWPWTGARFSVWNQRDYGLTRFISKFEARAVKNTPLFVANSKHIAEYLIRELGASPRRVRIVPNGIRLPSPELDRQGWHDRLGVPDNSFLACMVANLHDLKDHATLLKSWRIVVDRAGDQKPILLLAGRFETSHHALKALAFDLNLNESVRFLGAVTDVAGLLGSIDLGVFSSRSEGSPNGVLECMAAGLPMAGTDIPPIREAMPPDQYSFLTPPGDHESLANAILTLLADKGLRTRLGELNRQQVEAFFSKEQMCESMLNIIVDGLSTQRTAESGKETG